MSLQFKIKSQFSENCLCDMFPILSICIDSLVTILTKHDYMLLISYSLTRSNPSSSVPFRCPPCAAPPRYSPSCAPQPRPAHHYCLPCNHEV